MLGHAPAMFSFLPLASGSQGNSILIKGPGGAFLIDAGLPRRELLARLASAGQDPRDLTGIVLTHRHLDHVRAAGSLARRFRLPVWATERTACHQRALPELRRIHPHVPFEVAGCMLHPVQLCHDAPETLAFMIEVDGQRIGVATDLGSSGGGLTSVFRSLDVLYLEFNHDAEMLREGPYPASLKERVAGPQGHLSNAQGAELLKQLACRRLRRLYLAHLSETNNRPELASAAAAKALAEIRLTGVEIEIALQHEVSPAWTGVDFLGSLAGPIWRR